MSLVTSVGEQLSHGPPGGYLCECEGYAKDPQSLGTLERSLCFWPIWQISLNSEFHATDVCFTIHSHYYFVC